MSRTIHMCVNVRAQIEKPLRQLQREWAGAIHDAQGNEPTTGRDIRAFWMDQLAQGREVIPFGSACEGFDYKKGCPGHENADSEEKIDRGPAKVSWSPVLREWRN